MKQKNQFMLSEKTINRDISIMMMNNFGLQPQVNTILQRELINNIFGFWYNFAKHVYVYYYQYNTNPSQTSHLHNDYIHLKDIDIIGRESNSLNKKSSTSKRAGPTVRDFITAIQSEFGTIKSVEWPINSSIENTVLLNKKVYR